MRGYYVPTLWANVRDEIAPPSRHQSVLCQTNVQDMLVEAAVDDIRVHRCLHSQFLARKLYKAGKRSREWV
jgi:hypothetical protein